MSSGRLSFPFKGRLWASELFSVSTFIIEIPVLNANSADPDLRYVASDLGLHCLALSLLWTLGINGLTQQYKHF